MKKYLILCLLAGACFEMLSPCLASAQEPKLLSPQLELVSGIGLSYGQVVSLTPQAIFLGEYENGWAFGPGIGLRAGIVTVDYTITDKSRDIQDEIDLSLFYRLRYAPGRFFGAIDLGASLGLLSYYEKQWSFGSSKTANSKCRTSGLFLEPQAGVSLDRFSVSIGAMIYQSDYSLTTLKGDEMSIQRFENDWALALCIHFAYSL